MIRALLATTALAGLLVASVAEARIVQVTIDKVEPFAPGTSFGAAGAYERVVGRAKGELDPADPRNAGIVNLDRAPRNAAGKVEYETDLFMLRPVDASKSNRKIIYEVNNRGRKFLLNWILEAPTQAAGALNDPKEAKDAGTGMLFRQGWTIVWSGWDPDAPRAGGGLAMTVPVATAGGAPIVRTIREELVSGTRAAPAERFRLSWPAASLDPRLSRLTQRRQQGDAAVEIPTSAWEYVDERTIRLMPDTTKPQPGTLYELHYPATQPKVMGIGYAATRDVVSFLRYDTSTANPARPGTRHVLGFGISQSGRYLRDHIGQGFNQDEQKRRVFDGVLAHISGVGRVFLNAEFGEPGRTNTQHEDHTYPENEFPFSTASLTDPVTGKRGSLFRRDGFDPLLIETNTSTEYWQKGASLLHTDPLGRRDVDLPERARVYLIAGTQHGGRGGLTSAPGPCANPRNPHSPAPALRALLVALDRWVTDGIEPPASRVPTLGSGTLVAAEKVAFPAIPGAAVAKTVNRVSPPRDWVAPGAEPKQGYVALVSKVDADGNEVAGIRLPDIAVPLATYTGWNLYKEPFPAGALCDRDGSYLAFARTKADRTARNDPRPSIEERYGSHEKYVAAVKRAADDLVARRLLLAEDAAGFVARAKAKNPLAP
jgi:hypothetical protein